MVNIMSNVLVKLSITADDVKIGRIVTGVRYIHLGTKTRDLVMGSLLSAA